MKILQLCKKFPYPLKDGESIAVTYLASAMQQLGCEMTLLSMNTTKHPFDIRQLPPSYNYYKNIHLVGIDNRIKPIDAFLNLFTRQSYHIQRYISPEFEQKLIEILQSQQFDVIQLETLYLAPYVDIIRQYSNAKVVMRSHNVEYEIWKRITANTNIGAKKWYLQLLTKRLKQFEVTYLNKYDLLVAITQRDLNYFRNLGCRIPACVAPIGLDLTDYTIGDEMPIASATPSFCFIGSMDWLPNIEGVSWLLDNVWERVLAQTPNAKFHIAGRNMPDWLKQGAWQNVVVHGEVPNAVEFIQQHDAMLVPLLAGGGMRVKILEGMALGKLVISTALGLEGIDAQHNKDVLIADEPEDFAAQIIHVAQNPSLIGQFGKRASRFVHQHYDNHRIGHRLLEFYNNAIINNYVTS